VEYVPGDLTLTALAGTPLSEIEDTTAAHRQWLPLDPHGSPQGSIGATLATASEGPLAGFLGRPRDLAIGLTFVSGEGKVIQAGARVVKNVAGFDLVRLLLGSWGTLGVIVQVTVRLRARPAADETWGLDLPDSTGQLERLLERLQGAPLEPWATELVSAPLARRIGAGECSMIIVRLGGGHRAVQAQAAVLRQLGNSRQLQPAVWQGLRRAEAAHSVTLRLAAPVSDLPALWKAVLALAELGDGEAHASLARGIARTWIRPQSAQDLQEALDHHAIACRWVFERLPPDWWRLLAPPLLGDAISRRLRAAFDPSCILNPGILREEAL
jgi:glycolate oxidase FAD binding subunit